MRAPSSSASSRSRLLQTSDMTRPLLTRLSLRAKVTMLLLAISLGPLLVAGGININRAVEQGKRAERQRFAHLARFAAFAVNDLADEALIEVRLMARRFPVEAFDFDKVAAELGAGHGLRASLGLDWRDAPMLVALQGEYTGLFLALASGRVFYTFPFFNATDPLLLTAHPDARRFEQSGAVVSGPFEPMTTPDRPGGLAVAPMQTRSGVVMGYVGLVIATDRLNDLLQRSIRGFGIDADDGLSLALVDERGRILAHDDVRRLGQALDPALDAAPVGTAEIDYGTGRSLLSIADVPSTGWQVVLVTPLTVAYRHVYGLIWLLVVVIVLTFVFVLLLADRSGRVLLGPIRELEQGAQMIGAGALDYRIELDTHGGDELGRLARTFNEMGENLLRSRKQLEAYGRSIETARKELDAIVFGITHDLKKSLRGIEAFASFLGEDYADALDDEGLEMLGSISVNVDRINQLADDLIGLVEHEREHGKPVRFEMTELLEEARDRVLERQRGEVSIEGEMPSLTGDRARLLLVFDNLIDNGLKFNRSAKPRVRVKVADDILTWRFDVIDNGIGIEPRYRERIFELFARLNQQDAFSGNGTGLNLARRIVEEHRGRITVGDGEEGGTRFSVSLPKEAAEALTEPSVAALRLPGDAGA